MSSLYAMYIKERENKEIIESDKGFVTYKFFDNGECYIQDIYVIPSERKTGLSTKMTDEVAQIAKEKGCNALLGSICIDDKAASKNMQIWLNYGFKIHKNMGPMIYLRKDISGVVCG